jgi:hypothetical protein
MSGIRGRLIPFEWNKEDGYSNNLRKIRIRCILILLFLLLME